MIRRKFIALIGGAAAWPLAARAQQQAKVWRVGLLHPVSWESVGDGALFEAFRQQMHDLGYIEGRISTWKGVRPGG
jgi:putative tryptophan/tyrosine transport system substrate-binding protein